MCKEGAALVLWQGRQFREVFLSEEDGASSSTFISKAADRIGKVEKGARQGVQTFGGNQRLVGGPEETAGNSGTNKRFCAGLERRPDKLSYAGLERLFSELSGTGLQGLPKVLAREMRMCLISPISEEFLKPQPDGIVFAGKLVEEEGDIFFCAQAGGFLMPGDNESLSKWKVPDFFYCVGNQWLSVEINEQFVAAEASAKTGGHNDAPDRQQFFMTGCKRFRCKSAGLPHSRHFGIFHNSVRTPLPGG